MFINKIYIIELGQRMAYEEVQGGPKVIIFSVLFFVIFISTLAFNMSFNAAGAEPNIGPIIFHTIILILVAIALFGFRLETKIHNGNINIKYPILLNKDIPISEIKSVETITYRPLRDFGGWGIRYSKRGMMYSAKGKKAVKITLKNDETLFIGSQRPDEITNIITNIIQ